MDVTFEQVRRYRLRGHHLDRKLPPDAFEEAAGACGLQNSPPGAWETAMFNRVKGCTLGGLRAALYEEKRLLQAWSYRGVPAVFPAGDSGVFLTALRGRGDEQPWIYTRGVTAALDFVGIGAEELYGLVRQAAVYLDSHTVRSKEELDRVLARLVRRELPAEKQPLWDAPSMYGRPDRQTVGEAAVSFFLRPCSFDSLVVFGERAGNYPAFTSFYRWLGRRPVIREETERELVRRFLRCYGPSTQAAFRDWLGCSPRQAGRLWGGVKDELEEVRVEGKTRYLLAEEREKLRTPGKAETGILLLGAHDPYLDMRDREVILEQSGLARKVWTTVSNPGVVIRDGCVAGIWKGSVREEFMEFSAELFTPGESDVKAEILKLAEELAGFRKLRLRQVYVE